MVPADRCLPRLLELTQQSQDRPLRVLAGESLHAVLTLMVGRAACNPTGRDENKDSPFAPIYAKILPQVRKNNDTAVHTFTVFM